MTEAQQEVKANEEQAYLGGGLKKAFNVILLVQT